MCLPEQLCKFCLCTDGAETFIQRVSSETDFQYRSGNRASSFGRDCKGKTAEDKSTGKYRTERKETMGRSSDPVYAGRILDRAGKKEI